MEYQQVMPCDASASTERGRILPQRFVEQNDRGATRQGHVKVEDREIEMKRGVRRESVVLGWLELARAPVDKAERVGVRQHDSLGSAGRARGVQDVGETGGRLARAGGAAEQHQPTAGFAGHREAPVLDEPAGGRVLCQDEPHLAVREDEGISLERRRRIHRHIGGPAAQDRED